MKIFLIAMMVTFVGCNKGSTPSGHKSQDEARCLCMAETEFNLSSDQAFPAKLKLSFNEQILIDECNPSISRYPEIKIVRHEKSGTIEGNITGRIRGNLKVEILDRGEDCNNNAVYYENDSVEKEITIISDTPSLPPLDRAEIKL